MKKSFFLFSMLLCACAMLMTGCKKDQDQRFKLVIADQPQHKTSLGDGYTTNWQVDDQVYINGTTANDILTIGTAGNQYTWASDEGLSITPINGNYYAFYAGDAAIVSASIDATEQKFNFTMPSTYTYNPDNLHSPMAAMAADNSGTVVLNFYNLCSLLELEVPLAPLGSNFDIIIEEMDHANVPLSGNFSATYSTAGWATQCVSDAAYTLTVTKNTPGTTVYIPIPSGNHKLSITFSNLPGGASQSANYSFLAGKYYPINTLPSTPNGVTIAPYPFPTDGNGYAFFGKGNLVFHDNTDPKWSMEDEQWEYTPFTQSGTTVTASSYLVWMVSGMLNPEVPNNVTGTLSPSGYAAILGDSQHTANWTVPSQSEWNSILGLGTTTPLWAYVKINTGSGLVNGLFFTPSLSVIPSTYSLRFGTTYGSTNSSTSGWNNSGIPELNTTQFHELESLGCIFLPACGYVTFKGNKGTFDDASVGTGYYRTSTAASSNASAYVLKFDPTSAPTTTTTLQKGCGVSTRLLFVTNNAPNSSK